jgi:hypothetical protein
MLIYKKKVLSYIRSSMFFLYFLNTIGDPQKKKIQLFRSRQACLQAIDFKGISVLYLVRQVLYCLSHASSPFHTGYFGDRVLLFAQAGVDLDSPV